MKRVERLLVSWDVLWLIAAVSSGILILRAASVGVCIPTVVNYLRLDLCAVFASTIYLICDTYKRYLGLVTDTQFPGLLNGLASSKLEYIYQYPNDSFQRG